MSRSNQEHPHGRLLGAFPSKDAGTFLQAFRSIAPHQQVIVRCNGTTAQLWALGPVDDEVLDAWDVLYEQTCENAADD